MTMFFKEPAKASQPKKGFVFFKMWDAKTGKVQLEFGRKNVITLDASLIFAQSKAPNMLAIGTGATGDLLSPDAPQATQRRLNTEIFRKAFASEVFRDSDGNAVAYPTNIKDYTTVFGEGEAVGPLNEMSLVSTASANPAITNPILNGPSDYDPSIDTTGFDLLLNYLTFGVISKPATSVLAITWRITY